MRISDWSSDVCSSDLLHRQVRNRGAELRVPVDEALVAIEQALVVKLDEHLDDGGGKALVHREALVRPVARRAQAAELPGDLAARLRLPFPDMLEKRLAAYLRALLPLAFQQPSSEEHTSELQSLMRIPYAVFCLNKKTQIV